MARPRLHSFPLPDLLHRIANGVAATHADLTAKINATKAAAGESRAARDAWYAECQANGISWGQAVQMAEWQKSHPEPAYVDESTHDLERALKDLERWGIDYDLQAFTGRSDLTPSARIAAQTSIRGLEAAGLIQLFGAKAQSVRLTPAGWAQAGLADPFPATPIAGATA